ncbi:phage protease [Pseudogulbenkiania sp. MAI-1]|uniref:phage protease n=1 Tax=Pseudogulbenkiania sp. MAI-1 TaxID=990370 RepID=UPI000A04B7BC|nr:phage protease [Pseudogulbenkiania sp. MAI-1]
MQKPRHIRLSDGSAHRHIRVLAGEALLPDDGTRQSWVTITRTGSFTDPRYGRFEITRDMLLGMIKNFDARTLGVDVFLDVAHEPDKGAAATVKKLAIEGNKLRALVEWTDYGVEAVQKRGFKYLSADYHENFRDNEQGNLHGPLLQGAGLTTRPVIKHLDPVQLSCDAGGDTTVVIHPELARILLSEAKETMNKVLKALLDKLAAKNLSQVALDTVKQLGETQLKDVADEAEAQRICGLLEQAAVQLSEQLANLPAGHAAPVIQLSVGSSLSQDAINAAVTKVLADQATSARQLAETTDARRKLLSDTIGAAEGLDEGLKKELSEGVNSVITADWSEDQVRALAQSQINVGNQIVAARQLSVIGYNPAGTPHIVVPNEGTKKLSELYREHLSRTSTAGELHLDPKTPLHPFCALVLSEFDRIHGYQLDAELKVLAQGATDMGSTSLPVGVQREVIREALSDLNVLALVQTLTDFGAQATTQIPYEVRDTSQVMNDGIVYEGQPIPFAGVTQAMDLAYITPMKLALSITNEVMHFTRASAINWDALARNIESNARVLRELVHRRICNELQRAADSYLALPVANESFTAQLTGAKHTIKTTGFPIVRPFQARDLQGNAVGTAENPITVTLNSTVISQWDGSGKQPAGTYWRVLSYNLGTIQFVTQAGEPVTPANAGTNTISYGMATNVVKFDLDIQGGVTNEVWLNGLVQKIGSRKAMMSSQRYVKPNFMLMSESLNDTITNAEQFVAQGKRDGSDTDSQGDLASIKGVPSFGTNAPGVDLGDERILMGQRSVGAYTVAKPFITGEPIELTNNGQPIGKKVAYGEEYNAITVPKPVRNRFTSVVAYSATARAAI